MGCILERLRCWDCSAQSAVAFLATIGLGFAPGHDRVLGRNAM